MLSILNLPVLTHQPEITEESEAAAQELDGAVQDYLQRYFANQGIAQAEAEYSGSEYSPDTNGTPPDEDDFEDEAGEPRF